MKTIISKYIQHQVKSLSILMFSILSIFLTVDIQAQEKGNLNVIIDNIDKVKGNIVISMHNDSNTFPKKEGKLGSHIISVDSTNVVIPFEDLTIGDYYAIALYHDVNGDNKCNSNFFGIPKEPIAFSNNIKPKLSIPKFKDAKFKMKDKCQTITISLYEM